MSIKRLTKISERHEKSTFEVTSSEINHIRKYRDLDPQSKEMADFTFRKKWERSTAEAPKELKQPEEDIMGTEDF